MVFIIGHIYIVSEFRLNLTPSICELYNLAPSILIHDIASHL